jgi:hypothetical protein
MSDNSVVKCAKGPPNKSLRLSPSHAVALHTFVLMAAGFFWCAPAFAQNSPPLTAYQAGPALELSNRIPLNISEVITGGSWSTADANGTYRAVVVNGLGPDGRTDVVLQWLIIENDERLPKLAASASLRLPEEIDSPDIFVAFDIGDDGETMLIIGTYDFAAEEETLQFARLGEPSVFEFVDAPPQKNGPTQVDAPPLD